MRYFLTLFLIMPMTLFAHPGQKEEWIKRSGAREGRRWTLQEWLAQKERNQLMDLWLAMNSPSPYELSVQMGHYSYLKEQIQPPNSVEYKTYRGSVSAYAQIFGLSIDHENNNEEGFSDLSGSFNLRLLGNSIQNSHLNLSYGQRTREIKTATPSRLLQQFIDLSLDLHLSHYFGLIASYRSFVPTTDSTLGELTGSVSKAGLFIDYGVLRIYGLRTQEIFKTNTEIQRTGIEAGLQFFF